MKNTNKPGISGTNSSEDTSKQDIFETSDLGMTVALICMGNKPIAFGNSDHCDTFISRFHNTVDIEKQVGQYEQGKLFVSASEYFGALKKAKEDLYLEASYSAKELFEDLLDD